MTTSTIPLAGIFLACVIAAGIPAVAAAETQGQIPAVPVVPPAMTPAPAPTPGETSPSPVSLAGVKPVNTTPFRNPDTPADGVRTQTQQTAPAPDGQDKVPASQSTTTPTTPAPANTVQQPASPVLHNEKNPGDTGQNATVRQVKIDSGQQEPKIP